MPSNSNSWRDVNLQKKPAKGGWSGFFCIFTPSSGNTGVYGWCEYAEKARTSPLSWIFPVRLHHVSCCRLGQICRNSYFYTVCSEKWWECFSVEKKSIFLGTILKFERSENFNKVSRKILCSRLKIYSHHFPLQTV